MLKKWQHTLLTALAVLVVLLVVFNAVVFTQNREAQEQLAQRQQFVQQTVPLETLYREIVKALAEMAVKSNDQQVLGMLAAQGLNVTVNNPSAGAAEAPAPR